MTFERLANLIDGKLLNESFIEKKFGGLSIDSRTLNPGELFAAIKGEATDGHKFIDGAIKNDCAGLIIDRKHELPEKLLSQTPTVAVEDTHLAIKRLASQYVAEVNPTRIGLTGSNGKTTSKDVVSCVLKTIDVKTYASPGNLNNLYGLPLSIFNMPNDTKTAIFELGISNPGEMTKLTEIMTPNLALITNVGPTHLETLGTVEGVAEAKLELADAMDRQNPVLINADSPHLVKASERRSNRFITFAVHNEADFTASFAGINEDGFPLIKIENETIVAPLFGEHQIYNILSGYAIAKTLGYNIKPGRLNQIEYKIAPNRGQIERIGDLTIIADYYNANPTSMKSGLESFSHYVEMIQNGEKRATVVIGDMLELGENEIALHEEIGALLAVLKIGKAILAGRLAEHMYDSAVANGFNRDNIYKFESAKSAADAIDNLIESDDLIYFKASRGIGLETIINKLKNLMADSESR